MTGVQTCALPIYRRWGVGLGDATASLLWLRLQDMMVLGVLDATGLVDKKWARNLLPGYPLAAPLQIVLAIVALVGAWRWWRASLRAPVAA